MFNTIRSFCEKRSWYTVLAFLGFVFWMFMVTTTAEAEHFSFGMQVMLALFYVVPTVVGYMGGKEEASLK